MKKRKLAGCCRTSMVICGELMLNSCTARTLSLVLSSLITTATFTMSSPARIDSYAEGGMVWWSVKTADSGPDVCVCGRGGAECNLHIKYCTPTVMSEARLLTFPRLYAHFLLCFPEAPLWVAVEVLQLSVEVLHQEPRTARLVCDCHAHGDVLPHRWPPTDA